MRVSNHGRGRGRLLCGLIVVLLVVMVAAPASADRVCFKGYVANQGVKNRICTIQLLPGWGQASIEDDSTLPVTGTPYGWGVWVPSPLPFSDEGQPEDVLLTE